MRHVTRVLTATGLMTAMLVAASGLAAADPGTDVMPIPGGPVIVSQEIRNLHVSAVCNPRHPVGPVSLFEVTFDLVYPVDVVALSVRQSNGDGTFGPWMPSTDGLHFWQDTGTGVQWHWRSPLVQGWWQLRLVVPDPWSPAGSMTYLHPYLVNSCMPGRI